MKYVPHEYQTFATKFILEHPVSAIFLDMGLGKSVITLTAIYDLCLNSFEVSKVLVIAPLRVARDTWPAEIEKWEHLKGLTYSVAVGSELQRKSALMQQSNIYIINRENVDWLINESGLGVTMPEPNKILSAKQKDGKDLVATQIYGVTWQWLSERGCAALVSPLLLERYSMSVARWIQCEEVISEYGFLAKHPTTGAAIASPYVSMSQNFMSQTNRLWCEIYQIVKENCTGEYKGANPQDDVMERLLSARKGK